MDEKLTVIVEHDKHGYYVHAPQLPGCQSQGSSAGSALRSFAQALELWQEANRVMCDSPTGNSKA